MMIVVVLLMWTLFSLNQPFQPAPAQVPTPLAGWMSSPPAVSHPTVSGAAIGLSAPTNPGRLCY